MNINIKWTNTESDQTTFDYIHKKLEGIDKIGPDILQVDCEVEKDAKHQSGEVYRFEVNIDIPGKLLRAEEKGSTILECIDTVKDDITRQVRKHKEMSGDKHKRDTLQAKEETHTSPLADQERAAQYMQSQPKYDEKGNVIS